MLATSSRLENIRDVLTAASGLSGYPESLPPNDLLPEVDKTEEHG